MTDEEIKDFIRKEVARQLTASKASPALYADDPSAFLDKQHNSGVTYRKLWTDRFPALDGKNGRPTLDEVVEAATQWNADKPPKQRKSERGWSRFLLGWIQRDYPRFKKTWEDDKRFGRAPLSATDLERNNPARQTTMSLLERNREIHQNVVEEHDPDFVRELLRGNG